jgi:ELWxxDGT repeat protein
MKFLQFNRPRRSSRGRQFLLAAAFLFFASALHSQQPYLVRDINAAGGFPELLVNVNGTLFFTANDGSNGRELWKSDGTEAGTVLVKDINSGGGDSSPSNLANVNGTLFFSANNGTNGFELWKSDGTEAGTVLVKDINPGAANSSPFSPTNVGGTLFFTTNDGTNGRELWKSDGTEAGTVLVKDINSGVGDSGPLHLTNLSGTLFFSADDGSTGTELYALHVASPALSNISTRGVVETGDFVMIAGFIIRTGPKRVLIRALGPTLDQFSVPDTLDDPNLTIFDGPTQIATNDNWKDSQQTEIEATGLPPGFDPESAVILELEPGPYTAIVSGVGATTGVAIVEVFELE